jgi:hypothetical protein
MKKLYQDVLSKIKSDLTLLSPLPDQTDVLAKILLDCDALNEGLVDEIPSILANLSLGNQTFNGRDFSQFPLTILNHLGYLDLYFWSDSNTSIHDHNFSGAFKVLKGTYYQNRYSFKHVEDIADWVMRGELSIKKIEQIKPLEVVSIPRGEDFIHLTHHQDGMCVTACLRTENRQGAIHSYFPPGLRLEYRSLSINEAKLVDYLHFLCIDHKRNQTNINETIKALPDFLNWQIEFGFNLPLWLKSPFILESNREILLSKIKSQNHIVFLEKCMKQQKIDQAKWLAFRE